MDIKNLFTIGEMGGLFRTNIRTLRYYDDIGLLKPEVVDPKTGYRYYSARQFERMNTIKYLRNLNMPLDKIKAFFENRDTLVMEQILEEQLQETRAQLARLQAIERKLTTRLEQLDYAWLPEGDFLAIWYAGTHQDSAIYYKKLLAHMDTLGLECCGDSVEITWIDSGFTDDTEKYVTELQLPVRAKAPYL